MEYLIKPRKVFICEENSINSINRVFSRLWADMDLDIDKYKTVILTSPTIETHRAIYLETHPQETPYIAHAVFNQLCDRYFQREHSSPTDYVHPADVRYVPILPSLSGIPSKWLPYVEVFNEPEVVDVKIVQKTIVHKIKKRVNVDLYRWEEKEVEEPNTFFDRDYIYKDYHKFRFNADFQRAYHTVSLTDDQAKKYKQLEKVAEDLNRIFDGTDLLQFLPDFFTYDWKTHSLRPSSQYGQSMAKFLLP